MTDNELIITALKKYIQIVNEIKQLRSEVAKRESIRKQLAPILMEYLGSTEHKKIRTNEDTLIYTEYKSKECFSKQCTERIALEYFKNAQKAKDFVEFYEKNRQTIVRHGIKHTKPRKIKKRVPKSK
jgi:hypothetical protein